MKKFQLRGIISPGRINLPEHGTFDLEKIDDVLAENLWRAGLPFIEPKPEYLAKFFPGMKTLKPATIIPSKKNNNKSM